MKDIENRGGYMSVNELTPGHYTLKVWAEGEERYADSYIYGEPNSQDISSLTCRINRSECIVDHDLTSLYHGRMPTSILKVSE